MFGLIAKSLASLSLALKQPLASFCDLQTTDGDMLVGKRGERVTFVRVMGLRRMTLRSDVEAIAEGLRIDLSGSLENPGHAIQAWYACDPDRSGADIERHLSGSRAIAREIGLDLSDFFLERTRLWPRIMRWEACYLVLWSKTSLLNREEKKQSAAAMRQLSEGAPAIGDAQSPFRGDEILSARHAAFVQRVLTSFRNHGVSVDALTPSDALAAIREAVYPESAGGEWRPCIQGTDPMPRMPDGVPVSGDAGLALWPALADQLFFADAVTHGSQRVSIGGHEWSSVDMTVGPEDPRPFAELVARVNAAHMPWRMSMLVEGGGRNMMAFKRIVATLLGFVPSNKQIFNAFTGLGHMRESNADIAVKLRSSFATWAPEGETGRLRRNAATLRQRVEAWGNCQALPMAGDPLEGVMSSAPGLAVASTGPAAAAPLGEVLRMLPWGRPASPWPTGSVLFRTPDGRMWPYDAAGSMRTMIVDLFVAPSGFGKSVLNNTMNLGLCLSSAAQGATGARLPLIGKLDIGPSAEGFVRCLQEALPPHRRGEAIYVPMQLADGFEVNVFDTQVGCRQPLPLERAFQSNFLSLATLPIDSETAFEGMDQLIGFVIEEVYRMFGDDANEPNKKPKRYQRGLLPEVDEALLQNAVPLEAEPWWWDVVDALCKLGQYRLAEMAQRYALPLLQDLITAARTTQVRDMFAKVRAETTEETVQLFERYIKALIRRYPTLNRPTTLDFGPARVIVLDLEAVAPTGSAEADRQTDLMYLLGRHILARNFFLRAKYARFVPELVREYHTRRMTEIHECLKRLDYDEYHRTKGRRFVRAQVELDRREGRKHNLQLALSSQKMGDFGDDLVSQSTGRFILGAGDDMEAEDIITRFRLTDAAAEVIRHRLKGPAKDGSGAPFLAIIEADNVKYEQMLVNSPGPVELWALSTTPDDVSLRNRLYGQVGFSEGLRRLSRVFPLGSAKGEIDRRKAERLRRGEEEARAAAGVIEGLADELTNGRGLGIVLRNLADEPTPRREPSAVQSALEN
jgi:intracellular multiplication protein IcmB